MGIDLRYRPPEGGGTQRIRDFHRGDDPGRRYSSRTRFTRWPTFAIRTSTVSPSLR